MNEDRSLHEEERDPTISSLLKHLKIMRETVPVNYQLKAELKKKLMAQMMSMKTAQSAGPIEQEPRKKPKWQIYSWLLGAIGLAWFLAVGLKNDVSIRQVENLQDRELEKAAIVQLAPKEDHLALLVGHEIIVLDENRKRSYRMSLPLQQEKVTSLAWSPRGEEWAWVKSTPQSSQVWISQMQGPGSRLMAEFPAEQIDGLAWSPDGKGIYASFDNQVWLISTVSPKNKVVTAGNQPSPSPDGNHLAVVVNGKIKIVDKLGEKLAAVSEGSFPQWIDEKNLLYLDPQRRVMAVNPFSSDGPRETLDLSQNSSDSITGLQVSGDGQRVLIERRTPQGEIWSQGEVRK
ncbi:TolB family protein [Ammoniphilus sp. 3BR4]|uniref:TolB family protein n=1 Tax=Ammoniphilus sp. 3BR4 TaxID=3158265 RepID=UPI00346636D0